MNKASLDLILLVVEYTQKELNKIKEEIAETRASIVSSYSEADFREQQERSTTEKDKKIS